MTLPLSPADDSVVEAKRRLRAAMKAARRGLTLAERHDAADALAGFAEAIAGAGPAGWVAGYVAIRGEIDPAPLMQALRERGWRLALPRIEGEDISFRAFEPGDGLACGGFGLSEPQADAAVVVPDLVLVPLLAFDRSGNRLGYGRGYYDRALTRLGAVRAIGLAYGMQAVAAVPVSGHDRGLAQIATETGLIDCTA